MKNIGKMCQKMFSFSEFFFRCKILHITYKIGLLKKLNTIKITNVKKIYLKQKIKLYYILLSKFHL